METKETLKDVWIQVSNVDLKSTHPVLSAVTRRIKDKYFVHGTHALFIAKIVDGTYYNIYHTTLPEKAKGFVKKRIRFQITLPVEALK